MWMRLVEMGWNLFLKKFHILRLLEPNWDWLKSKYKDFSFCKKVEKFGTKKLFNDIWENEKKIKAVWEKL